MLYVNNLPYFNSNSCFNKSVRFTFELPTLDIDIATNIIVVGDHEASDHVAQKAQIITTAPEITGTKLSRCIFSQCAQFALFFDTQ